MKVALFTHELGISGAPMALFNMAKCLLKNGHEVDLYSPFDGPLGMEFKKIGINVMIRHDILEESIVNEPKEYDALLFNTIVSLIAAKNTKNWKSGKRIVWIHEGSFAYNLFETTTMAYGLGRKLDFKNLLQYVDEIYCVSGWSEEITKKYTDKETKILPYYIEYTNHVRNHKPHQGLVVGMIGTVEKRKGIKLLADALEKVPNDVCVVSIGNVMQYVPSNKIKYLGKQNHDFVLSVYDSLDLLICPSEDDPMPTVCAEAFMVGCPVFVSKNTGTCSLIENKVNGFVFEYSVNEIANAIKWAYDNKNLLENIGENGKKIYKENFKFEIFNENINSIFNKIK